MTQTNSTNNRERGKTVRRSLEQSLPLSTAWLGGGRGSRRRLGFLGGSGTCNKTRRKSFSLALTVFGVLRSTSFSEIVGPTGGHTHVRYVVRMWKKSLPLWTIDHQEVLKEVVTIGKIVSALRLSIRVCCAFLLALVSC